jgi:hypothetical protein
MSITPEQLQGLERLFPDSDFEEVPEGIRVIPRAGSPEYNRRQVHSRIEEVIDRFETDAADDATWNALTAARRIQTTRLAVLVVAKLARLVLGRLEKP